MHDEVPPFSNLAKTSQSCSVEKASSRHMLGAHRVAQLLEDILLLVGGARRDWDLRSVLHKALEGFHGHSGGTSNAVHSETNRRP